MTLALIPAFLIGSAVLAVLVWVGSLFNGRRGIDSRLNVFVSSSGSLVELPEHVSDDQPNQLTERLNERLGRLGSSENIRRNLARADVPLTVAEYMLVKVAATLLPSALVVLLTRSVVALPFVALIGFFAPTLWLRQRQRRRSKLFADQLPGMLNTIIGSLRGGFSLSQALSNVPREAPEPTALEMRRVVQEIQLGLSIDKALTNLAQRMESEDLELLVAVLKIHGRVGGNLTVVLENISTTIMERTRLRREINVITSQQRYASYVLGLLPVILALLLLTINPNYMMRLFAPGWTLCIPAFAVIMNVLGFAAIQKIVDIKI